MRKEQITGTNNSVCNHGDSTVMEEKGMKQKLMNFTKKMVPAVFGALMGVILMSTTCYAAGKGVSTITKPLDNLKTLSDAFF